MPTKKSNAYRLNGRALKEFLSWKRLSQASFGQMAGLDPSSVSNLINGRQSPGRHVAYKIMNTLSKLDCSETRLFRIFPSLGYIKMEKPRQETEAESKDDVSLIEDMLTDDDLLGDIDL